MARRVITRPPSAPLLIPVRGRYRERFRPRRRIGGLLNRGKYRPRRRDVNKLFAVISAASSCTTPSDLARFACRPPPLPPPFTARKVFNNAENV